ncbi:MAG: ABC transporter permease [Alistipes sp.]|nr:ABC transporter permease [Alistipes sp.]
MSFVTSVLSVLKRELREVVNDRLYLSVLLLLPALMVLFFVVMFSSGTIVSLPIVVVDRDDSVMSRRVISMVDATRGVDVAFEATSIDEAEHLMLSGEVVAILYVDDGFERDIYHGVPTQVECYVSGASISAAGVVESDVQQAVRTFSAGVALSRLQALGVPYSQAMVDIMPVNFHTYTISNPYLNYGYYLAPIFMFMGIVIFTVLATIFAIGRELYYATASEWLSRASGSLPAAVVGKLLPIAVSMTLFMQIIFLVLFVVMGMDCRGSYLMLTLGSIIFILAYQSVAVVIIALTANLRLALSLGGGYSVMAFTFSGITFPTESMYGIAQGFAHLFPLTYFCDLFIDQAMRGIEASQSLWAIIALLLFLVLIPIVWHRMKRVVSGDKYLKRD